MAFYACAVTTRKSSTIADGFIWTIRACVFCMLNDLYDNFETLSIIIGARDSILDRKSMIARAEQNDNNKVVKTTKTNHFISLEHPDSILKAVCGNAV